VGEREHKKERGRRGGEREGRGISFVRDSPQQ